jgi:hypothetical protein
MNESFDVPPGRTAQTVLVSRAARCSVQVKCRKCQQLIALSDNIESTNGSLSHADCLRPRNLNPAERQLLFIYCSDHAVARCLPCDVSFRQTELAADPLGSRTNICPRCRRDLTENVRAHLYRCTIVPPEVRLRAQAVREAAQRLVKRSEEVAANGELIREAEVTLFEAQRLLKTEMSKRSQS